MKQNKKKSKNIQNANTKKTEFFNSANSILRGKISGIGPWVSRIN
jgi:hypothetical protein